MNCFSISLTSLLYMRHVLSTYKTKFNVTACGTGWSFMALNLDPKQTRNQEFLKAREVSWNQGTSINNHLQHEKERSQRQKSPLFLLQTFKNCTLNDTFNPQMTAIRAFFPKIRTIFSSLQKRELETSPTPPQVTRLAKPYNVVWTAVEHQRKSFLSIFTRKILSEDKIKTILWFLLKNLIAFSFCNNFSSCIVSYAL